MLKVLIIIGGILWLSHCQGIIQIALQKTLYIPAGGYSVLNISNKLDKLEQNTMYGQINVDIGMRNQYTNGKFDIFSVNMTDNVQTYANGIECFVENILTTARQYENNTACNMMKCEGYSYQGPTTFFRLFLNMENASSFSNASYLIDNTLVPCEGGAFYPQIELLQTIGTTLQPNFQVFDALKITLLVMIEVLVIMCAWNVVLYNKYKSCKKKLGKLKEKNKEKELISSIGDFKRSLITGLQPAPYKLRRANTTAEYDMKMDDERDRSRQFM